MGRLPIFRHGSDFGFDLGAVSQDLQFCYFHQRLLRSVKTPPNVRIHPVALIEDEESTQVSLMEVINALARKHTDLRRADLILKALFIPVKNSRRVRFHVPDTEIVRKVPDYPVPAAAEVSRPGSDLRRIAHARSTGRSARTDFSRLGFMVSFSVKDSVNDSSTMQASAVEPAQRKAPARARLPAARKAAVNAHPRKRR